MIQTLPFYPHKVQSSDEYHESEASRLDYVFPEWTRGRKLGREAVGFFPGDDHCDP